MKITQWCSNTVRTNLRSQKIKTRPHVGAKVMNEQLGNSPNVNTVVNIVAAARWAQSITRSAA